MNKKMKIIFAIAASVFIIVAIVGVAFAAGTIERSSGENAISTGVVTFEYAESGNALSINGADNMLDSDGKIQSNYFAFSVSAEATGSIDIGYYIYITPETTNTLEKSAVKVHLSQVENTSVAITSEQEIKTPTLVSNLVPFDVNSLAYSASSNNLLLATNKFTFNNTSGTLTHYYRLRLWLDNDYALENNLVISDSDDTHTATLTAKTFKLKLNVYGTNGQPKNITA